MTDQDTPMLSRQTLPAVAVLYLVLTVILAPSALGATNTGSSIASARFAVSRSTAQIISDFQDSNVHTIKEAGIQFEVPKGWKAEVDKDSGNVVLSVEDGAVTITFVVEDKYVEVVTGMKAGLKERLTDMKSDGEPKQDTVGGMVHIAETGAGMLKDSPVIWSIDVLKATKNVTILTFGIQKVMEAHGNDYTKWVSSIKKI